MDRLVVLIAFMYYCFAQWKSGCIWHKLRSFSLKSERGIVFWKMRCSKDGENIFLTLPKLYKWSGWKMCFKDLCIFDACGERILFFNYSGWVVF